MGLILQDAKESKKFEIAPAGAYVGRCFQVIDLGTQSFQKAGETSQSRKLAITWEIDQKMSDGRPFTVTARYTNSTYEKSNLGMMLASWRGKPVESGFDMDQILGQYCLVNIVHQTSGDKTYANVASVMRLPQGMPKFEPFNEILSFSLAEFSNSTFEKLTPYWQSVIEKSPEFQQIDNFSPAAEEEDLPF